MGKAGYRLENNRGGYRISEKVGWGVPGPGNCKVVKHNVFGCMCTTFFPCIKLGGPPKEGGGGAQDPPPPNPLSLEIYYL